MTTTRGCPGAESTPCMTNSSEGLRRRLTARQLSMIAIGGAIGVGLFLGSNVTIRLAGPAVILTYLLGAVLALIMAYSLAEMAVVHPVAGSFGIYAERYLGPWFGFTVRATYGLIQIVAIGAEVTAVAIYFQYWFAGTPQWVWVAAVSAGIVAINAFQVGMFGELEYWFSMVKVVAIIVFIVVGIALISGLSPRPALGFRNLVAYGGFLPHGYRGVWLAFPLTIASYMGVEVVAVTAGEARRPEESIPRAMHTMVFRLILFYILTIAVMVTMAPWNRTGAGTISGSPFVRAFETIGIPHAPLIMNLVVIMAALSSANTNLYLSTRMLFSLAGGGHASTPLSHLSVNGVPHRALAVSSLGMAVAILLAIYMPKRAFLLMYGAAVSGMLFVWIVILTSHLRFRRSVRNKVNDLPLRLRLFPFSNILGIAVLVAIGCSTFSVDGLQYSVPTFAVLLAAITCVYWNVHHSDKASTVAQPKTGADSSPSER